MKKLIAVLIALAMVLSMSVMAFASWEVDGEPIISPSEITTKEIWDRVVENSTSDLLNADVQSAKRVIYQQKIYTKEDNITIMTWDEAWAVYYNIVLSGASNDPVSAITEIVNSVADGNVNIGTAITNVGNYVTGGIGGDGEGGDLSSVVDQIMEEIRNIGNGQTEGEVSSDAYAEELVAAIKNGDDTDMIVEKIKNDLDSKYIVAAQIPEIAEKFAQLVKDDPELQENETVQKINEYLDKIKGGEGFPAFGDITLPWDIGNSESGSFLDTILGIIGSIGDLFNPSEPDDPANGDIGSGDDLPSSDGSNGISDADTGDVSFVAVAAVAAVAGAALILTRKKNDAEAE